MSTQVRLVITNATQTQNAIKNVEVTAVSADDEYRINVIDPRKASSSYLAVTGNTTSDIATDLAADLNAADGVTSSATAADISVEVAGGRPIDLSTSRWLHVTDKQLASQARDIELPYMRGQVVPAGGSLTLNTQLEAIEANGSLESLRSDEARGLISVTVLPLSEGVVREDVALDAAANLDDLTIDGNLDLTGGDTFSCTNTVITGDLTVDATSSIDFTSVVVGGAVTLASGAGTVAWKGGSFHGAATDADAKLGAAASGSYLNV